MAAFQKKNRGKLKALSLLMAHLFLATTIAYGKTPSSFSSLNTSNLQSQQNIPAIIELLAQTVMTNGEPAAKHVEKLMDAATRDLHPTLGTTSMRSLFHSRVVLADELIEKALQSFTHSVLSP